MERINVDHTISQYPCLSFPILTINPFAFNELMILATVLGENPEIVAT